MKTATKVWLVLAASLVLIGCIVFTGVMAMLDWNFSKLSTVKYETNSYEIHEDYKNISIVTKTADIVFVPSESQKTSVVCHEQKNSKHSVTAKNGTLVIEAVDTRKWYEHIGIFFGTPKITVHIPQGEYGALSVNASTGDIEMPKDFTFREVAVSLSTGDVDFCASASETIVIKTSTGDICVEDISAGSLDLSVSTGKVTASSVTCMGDVTVRVSTGKAYLTDIGCKSIVSRGNTGGISLDNVIAKEKISIERSTGDVKFESCDAAEIFVKTDTGDVTGTLLTDKVFVTQTDTGSVDVPKSVTGGNCEITTSTGDIKMNVDP